MQIINKRRYLYAPSERGERKKPALSAPTSGSRSSAVNVAYFVEIPNEVGRLQETRASRLLATLTAQLETTEGGLQWCQFGFDGQSTSI